MSGMLLTISVTAYLSFLLVQILPLCPQSSIASCQSLVYPKLLRRIRMVASSFISVSSLTRLTCVSPFLQTRSNVLSTSSISYCPLLRSHCRPWNPPLVSSHCCQVVPLGRPFLRQLFALLCRSSERHRFHRIRIPHAVKRDLKWWQ